MSKPTTRSLREISKATQPVNGNNLRGPVRGAIPSLGHSRDVIGIYTALLLVDVTGRLLRPALRPPGRPVRPDANRTAVLLTWLPFGFAVVTGAPPRGRRSLLTVASLDDD
jgi:hypothetical protein